MKNLSFNPSEILEQDQLKSILGGGPPELPFGEDCTVLCNDDTRVQTDDCASSTAQNACGNHGGANSCAGSASSCG